MPVGDLDALLRDVDRPGPRFARYGSEVTVELPDLRWGRWAEREDLAPGSREETAMYAPGVVDVAARRAAFAFAFADGTYVLDARDADLRLGRVGDRRAGAPRPWMQNPWWLVDLVYALELEAEPDGSWSATQPAPRLATGPGLHRRRLPFKRGVVTVRCRVTDALGPATVEIQAFWGIFLICLALGSPLPSAAHEGWTRHGADPLLALPPLAQVGSGV